MDGDQGRGVTRAAPEGSTVDAARARWMAETAELHALLAAARAGEAGPGAPVAVSGAAGAPEASRCPIRGVRPRANGRLPAGAGAR